MQLVHLHEQHLHTWDAKDDVNNVTYKYVPHYYDYWCKPISHPISGILTNKNTVYIG